MQARTRKPSSTMSPSSRRIYSEREALERERAFHRLRLRENSRRAPPPALPPAPPPPPVQLLLPPLPAPTPTATRLDLDTFSSANTSNSTRLLSWGSLKDSALATRLPRLGQPWAYVACFAVFLAFVIIMTLLVFTRDLIVHGFDALSDHVRNIPYAVDSVLSNLYKSVVLDTISSVAGLFGRVAATNNDPIPSSSHFGLTEICPILPGASDLSILLGQLSSDQFAITLSDSTVFAGVNLGNVAIGLGSLIRKVDQEWAPVIQLLLNDFQSLSEMLVNDPVSSRLQRQLDTSNNYSTWFWHWYQSFPEDNARISLSRRIDFATDIVARSSESLTSYANLLLAYEVPKDLKAHSNQVCAVHEAFDEFVDETEFERNRAVHGSAGSGGTISRPLFWPFQAAHPHVSSQMPPEAISEVARRQYEDKYGRALAHTVENMDAPTYEVYMLQCAAVSREAGITCDLLRDTMLGRLELRGSQIGTVVKLLKSSGKLLQQLQGHLERTDFRSVKEVSGLENRLKGIVSEILGATTKSWVC